MSVPADRRSRKRLATRQSISDAATRLFFLKGFDRVSIDEIAEAADVGRMTVFNHFPRKEDLFFDRDEEFRGMLRETLERRDSGTSPVEALRLLAHRLVAGQSPYVDFSAMSQGWVETIEKSETLKARARAIRDELAHFLAGVLATCAGQPPADPAAHLAADLLLATWTVARVEAHRASRQGADAGQAGAVFLALVDQGSAGIEAALQATPYA